MSSLFIHGLFFCIISGIISVAGIVAFSLHPNHAKRQRHNSLKRAAQDLNALKRPIIGEHRDSNAL